MPVTSSATESVQEFNRKRDAFIVRFQKGIGGKEGVCSDKVISEANWDRVDSRRRENDKYWQTVRSISLTPMAKFGIGKLWTFEFLAPSFEDVKPPKLGQFPKEETPMSFYGNVHFDFR